MPEPTILDMRDIVKEFPGGVRALDGVSLSVTAGEVHAICGENGAGKSTLMKVLSGVYPHGSYQGSISFDGHPAEYRNITDSEADGIVIIHQELALSPYLSIAENLFLGNERAKRGIIDWNRTNLEAMVLLERVGLSENPATPVQQLGVGKQQLIEIAKALAKDVKLLILDEPTAALNDDDSAHLLQLIDQLRTQGITCIIISHKLKEIQEIADSVTIIRDGKTIETFSMSEEGASEARIIRSMVGRELSQLFPAHVPNIGAEMLRVEGWTVRHPQDHDRLVVDDASFSVRAGEIVGFAGLMGAGRTELAMSIFGHSYGTVLSGHVYKDGVEIHTRTIPEAISHRIAYVTEDRKRYGLNLIESITSNITIAGIGAVSKRGIINPYRENSIAEGFRTRMGIKTQSVATHTGKLSGGNQQKVVLSKWLHTGPDVLILDEPTRGVDVGAKHEIYTVINELAQQGKAIVVISSELPELLGLSDRIYTIAEGQVTGELPRAEATQEALMTLMTSRKDRS
ncbi:putative multiple sugar transport system ATP-binding protein [Leucobacter exalbidus]|uniref:Multiple sugar transport system ATP-binding protein n=1 Tax=Leucobacter exalbidus TaxID=662960 RepID=A0A940PMG3_9MICO|nr:multiple monosaccharide ABC transporter ATP-binding protein [Leucobacter exalbidus]MBP1325838.1 putative multiple sugar transport system ATP-binding protein [Leucobacter exalbidus]